MDDQKENERIDPMFGFAKPDETDALLGKFRQGKTDSITMQEILAYCPVGYITSHETNEDRWTVAGWHYVDDMSGEQIFVIDKYGRLLAPHNTFKIKKRFIAEVADFEVWCGMEKDWLILSWTLNSPNEGHQCGVIKRPDELSVAQKDRVSLIQNNLTEEWHKKTCGLATLGSMSAIHKGAVWSLL